MVARGRLPDKRGSLPRGRGRLGFSAFGRTEQLDQLVWKPPRCEPVHLACSVTIRRRRLAFMSDSERDADVVPIEDVIVTIGHPHGDIDAPLSVWIERGPGPRPFVQPIAAKHAKTGKPLPLSIIPMQYRNDTESRRLIERGLIKDPWKG